MPIEWFYICAFILCAEEQPRTRLGKVRPEVISEDAIMMGLVSEIKNPDPSWVITNKKGLLSHKRTSVCQWRGVSCDSQSNVERIFWENLGMRGTLKGPFPRRLNAFGIWNNNLFGEIHVCHFPDSLTAFHIDCNHYTGSLDLTRLPPGMVKLSMYQNSFSGPLDISALPPTITQLGFAENKLTGVLNFVHLPKAFEFISLFGNNIVAYIPPSWFHMRLCVEGKSPRKYAKLGDATPSSLIRCEAKKNDFYQLDTRNSKPCVVEENTDFSKLRWKAICIPFV